MQDFPFAHHNNNGITFECAEEKINIGSRLGVSTVQTMGLYVTTGSDLLLTPPSFLLLFLRDEVDFGILNPAL